MPIQYTLETRYTNLKTTKSNARLEKILNREYGKMTEQGNRWFMALHELMQIEDNMSGKEAMNRLLRSMAVNIYNDYDFVPVEDFNYMSAKEDRPTSHEIYQHLPNHATITRWMNLISSAWKPRQRQTTMKVGRHEIEFNIEDGKGNVESVFTINKNDWRQINRLLTANDEQQFGS